MNKEPFSAWRWNQHMNRTIDEALTELEREAHIRLKCFDRWVEAGKLSWADAYNRLEALLSGIKHLRDMQTAVKLEQLRSIGPQQAEGLPQLEAWAQQAHNAVDSAPQSSQMIPFTATEASAEGERRQNTA